MRTKEDEKGRHVRPTTADWLGLERGDGDVQVTKCKLNLPIRKSDKNKKGFVIFIIIFIIMSCITNK